MLALTIGLKFTVLSSAQCTELNNNNPGLLVAWALSCYMQALGYSHNAAN